MVHNSGRSCEDDIPELTRRQQLDNPLLKVRYSNVVSWRDDASFIDAIARRSATGIKHEWEMCVPAIELDDDLARSVVIDLFKLSNIT